MLSSHKAVTGQLTSVTSPSGSVDYAYDATGRRVSRMAGGTATQFVYGLGGILQERQGSTWTAAYTYGSALLRRNSEVPLYDALGSERTVTDGSGAVTGSIAYEAFGQPVATSGSSASPYTFAATSGYRNDGDAGLTHVGARYYDAQVGRFVTRDTELDQHPYLYCDHDPVNALDPSGHEGICPDPVAIGELLGQISTIVRTVMPIPPKKNDPKPDVPGVPSVPGPIKHTFPIGDGWSVEIGGKPPYGPIGAGIDFEKKLRSIALAVKAAVRSDGEVGIGVGLSGSW